MTSQVRHSEQGSVISDCLVTIGLYRDVWIAAIASSTTSLATRTAAICVRFQGRRVRRVYVTMQITFLTRKSALIYRRQRVASLTINCNGDFAIRAYDVCCKPISLKLFYAYSIFNGLNVVCADGFQLINKFDPNHTLRFSFETTQHCKFN